MTRSLSRALLAAALLLSAACARHKIIPDDRLAMIFHDAFLANAYVGNRNIRLDSLNLYEPIFASYGYTTEDVQYTIGNFSKRKSARLGDVVERAIARLEEEGKYYDLEVAVLDTIDHVAVRTFTRTEHADSLIRVEKLADTARLHFVFDVEPGEYEVGFRYLVDSLDRNEKGLRSKMWLERRNGTRALFQSLPLRRGREETLSRRFVTDTTHLRLHVALLDFPAPPRRPSVAFTDFSVVYRPQARAAVERLYEKQLGIRIFADDFFGALRRQADTTACVGGMRADSLSDREKDSL